MSDQWTPTGDEWPQPAMVLVREHGVSYSCVKNTDNNSSYSIPSHYLRPMPPTITPEQQAVLDRAVRQEKAYSTSDASRFLIVCDTNEAVRAMLAAQQLLDPVAEVKAAFAAFCDVRGGMDSPSYQRLRAAIAALEARS